MVTDRFGMLLEELAKALQVPKLEPDKNNSCLLRFQDGLEVQIEIDHHSGDYLIVGIDLGELPLGKYRENLFLEALKANGLPAPRYGNLAFSKTSGHLVLNEMLTLNDISGGYVADFITQMLVKARVWKEAIGQGTLPIIAPVGASSQRGGGIFGLQP